EIAVRRRRRGEPLECRGIPWVAANRFSIPDAREEIKDERQLREAKSPRGNRDHFIPVEPGQAPDDRFRNIVARTAIIPAAVHAEHALQEHWQEDAID